MATPIKKCSVQFFTSSYQIFYEDQNHECLLRKSEQFSVVLEKIAVNIEVREKDWIVYKGQGNLILALSRCLSYKKISRIKFTELENPCINPYNGTGGRSKLSCPRKIKWIF